MHRSHRISRAILALALLVPSTLAAQTPPAKRKLIGGSVDLGYVMSSGNTSVTTFSFAEKATWNVTSYTTVTHQLKAIYGEANDKVNANALDVDFTGDYKLFDGVGFTGNVGFDRNNFAGIKRRFEESVGFSLRFATAAHDSVRFTGGILWTQQTNNVDTTRKYVAFRGGFFYKRPLSSNASISHGMEVIPNIKLRDDWRLNSETSLVAALSKKLGLKTAYTVKYDNLPEPTFKKTDRILTTGLQITY